MVGLIFSSVFRSNIENKAMLLTLIELDKNKDPRTSGPLVPWFEVTASHGDRPMSNSGVMVMQAISIHLPRNRNNSCIRSVILNKG